MSDTYHVTPSNDLREHVTDGSDCWCGPETEEVFQSPGVPSEARQKGKRSRAMTVTPRQASRHGGCNAMIRYSNGGYPEVRT